MVPEDLLFSKQLSDRAKTLYGILHRHVGRNDTAWPGRARLADLTNCSTDSIDRALKELEIHGWLVIDRRTGYRGSNKYRLLATQRPRAVTTQDAQTVDNSTPPTSRTAATSRKAADSLAAPVRPKREKRKIDIGISNSELSTDQGFRPKNAPRTKNPSAPSETRSLIPRPGHKHRCLECNDRGWKLSDDDITIAVPCECESQPVGFVDRPLVSS